MGKRPFIAITVSFITGLALGELFSYFPLTLIFFFSVFSLFDRRFKQGALLPIALLFCAGAGLLLQQLVSTPFRAGDLRRYIDRGEIDLVAQVDRPPQHFATQVLLEMEGIEIHADSIQPVHGSFRLTIYQPDAPFEYGDRLQMRIRLRHPQQFGTPGAFPYADYREREGWSGSAGLSDLDRIQKIGEGGNSAPQVDLPRARADSAEDPRLAGGGAGGAPAGADHRRDRLFDRSDPGALLGLGDDPHSLHFRLASGAGLGPDFRRRPVAPPSSSRPHSASALSLEDPFPVGRPGDRRAGRLLRPLGRGRGGDDSLAGDDLGLPFFNLDRPKRRGENDPLPGGPTDRRLFIRRLFSTSRSSSLSFPS
ncbi:MAG: DUF4131 domain-containing protein [Candidatus Manganitrophus sp.]|nr:DUF4131 domain-containing protein [Candidatus Manganitrophus sp.]